MPIPAEKLLAHKPNAKDTLSIAVLMLAALALTWFSYQPGIGMEDNFLQDTPPNLSALTEFNTAPSWAAALEFTTSGESGTLGRPISMASFLLEASEWPDNAGRFRASNLLLHLINGLLLLAVMLRLAPYLGSHGRWVAVLTTVLWLIHPIHTTTTLYVVQRMVLLSALFMLAGTWIYLIGRAQIERGRVNKGAMVMTSGLVLGVSFGVFAKENAILLPAMLLGLELSLLPKHTFARYRRLRVFQLFVLTVPLVAIAIYLMFRWPQFLSNYSLRSFSPGERLMTEARILLEYVGTILVPRTGDISVFHDGYAKSNGLLSPPSTLFALIFWLATIAASIRFRRLYPVIVGGIFWFLGSHLLESTILPLELYFQHRNYLGSAGILWILVYVLFSIPVRKKRFVIAAPILILTALFAGQTYISAAPYGSPLQAAIIWPEEQPHSSRARQFAVNVWLQYGNYSNAEKQMEAATKQHPTDAMLWLELAQMQCAQQKDTSTAVRMAISTARTSPLNIGMLVTFDYLREMIKAKRCESLSSTDLLTVLQLLLKNPYYAARRIDNARIWNIRAQFLADQGNFSEAVIAITKAKAFAPKFNVRFSQFTWLISSGQYDSARIIMEKARFEASDPNASNSSKKEYEAIHKLSKRIEQLPGNRYILPSAQRN